MAFTFIHTADWQIGKRFGRFPAERAALLGQARLEAVDRLAQAARGHGIAHILVAGDVFDTASPEPQTRRRLFERLKQHGDVRWHLLPGNHDPAQAGGLWDCCHAEGTPPNVVLHCEAGPVEIETGVWLLPSPLAASNAAEDPAAWMAEAATPEGALRIGLAHGSAAGFGGESPRSIDPAVAERAGLAYLALGDWHGLKKVGARAWYSGTPEPDRFKDNDPGFALCVTLETAHAAPTVVPVRTGRYRWATQTMRLAAAEEFGVLEPGIRGLCSDPGNLLLSLEVSGLVSLSDRACIAQRLEQLGAALFHLETELDRLEVRPVVDDLDRIDRAGELRAAAERLASMSGDTAGVESAVARGALARLYAWTAGARL
ncbi:MAG: exonuclease SbcCD subunit D [Parvibaculaceae bacterium]